jgi:hypothetical protein
MVNTYKLLTSFKEQLLNDIKNEFENMKKGKKSGPPYIPLGKPSQYAGLNMARDLEKYLGLIPFTIDDDDKYNFYLIDAREYMKNSGRLKHTKTPKCSPINKKSAPKDYKLLYTYFNPIPEKYNTGTPGFGLIDMSKYKKIKCNPKIKKGGKKRKTRKRKRKRKGGMFSPYAIYAMKKAEDNMRKEWNEEWLREQELVNNRPNNPINVPICSDVDESTQTQDVDESTQTQDVFFMVIPTRKNRFRRGGKRKTYNKKKNKKRSCTKKKR